MADPAADAGVSIVFHHADGSRKTERPVDAGDLREWCKDLDLELDDPQVVRVEIIKDQPASPVFLAVGDELQQPGSGAVVVLGADPDGRVWVQNAVGHQYRLPPECHLSRLPGWLRSHIVGSRGDTAVARQEQT